MNYLCILLISVFYSASLHGCTDVNKPKPPSLDSVHVIQVDLNNEHQKIIGFGASDCWRCRMIGKFWPEEKKNQIADLLFSNKYDENGNPEGIGLSLWRFNIGAGSAEQGPSSGIYSEWNRNECFMSEDGTFDMSKQKGQRYFLEAAKKRGVKHFLMFSLSPPVYMTRNGLAFPTEKQDFMNIKPDHIQNYADFLAESIRQMHDYYGITFDYLSPVNEPQYDWRTPGVEATVASNKDLSELTHALSHSLSGKGLSTQVVLGEAGALKYLFEKTQDAPHASNQIQELWKEESPLNICNLPNIARIISSHSYWSVWPVKFQISQRTALRSALNAVQDLGYWQTEYCVMDSPGEEVIPGGGGWQRDLGMQTALFVARVIHNDLVMLDASSWQWWTALSRADYKDGLIYLDDGTDNGNENTDEYCKYDGYIRESKLMWILGNYSFFVRPGMVRLYVTECDPESAANTIMVSAFKAKESGKLVIIAVNEANRPYRCKLEFSDSATVDELIPYLTSSECNLTRQTSVSMNDFVVPARSVVTYVATLK